MWTIGWLSHEWAYYRWHDLANSASLNKWGLLSIRPMIIDDVLRCPPPPPLRFSLMSEYLARYCWSKSRHVRLWQVVLFFHKCTSLHSLPHIMHSMVSRLLFFFFINLYSCSLFETLVASTWLDLSKIFYFSSLFVTGFNKNICVFD